MIETGEHWAHIHDFLVGNRFYQVLILFPKTDIHKDLESKLFDSFKLIKE